MSYILNSQNAHSIALYVLSVAHGVRLTHIRSN